jgi:hypothetical protein
MSVLNYFIEAIATRTNINTQNPFDLGEVTSIAKTIKQEDYADFLKQLSQKRDYHTHLEKLNAVHKIFMDSYFKEMGLTDLEEFCRSLEKKVYSLDQVAYSSSSNNDQYAHKIRKANFKDIKTKKGSYFDDKELYTLTHVGTLEECLKLINGGYDGFKNRIVSIVSEAEKKKFRKTVGLQENRIEKSNKIALGYGLEIKGIK